MRVLAAFGDTFDHTCARRGEAIKKESCMVISATDIMCLGDKN